MPERRSGSGSAAGRGAAAVTPVDLRRWCDIYPGLVHDLAAALEVTVEVVKFRAGAGELTRADVEAGLEFRRRRVYRAMDEGLEG